MNNLEDLIGQTVKVAVLGNHRWIKVEDVEEDGKNGRATIDGKLIKSTVPDDDIDRINGTDGEDSMACGVWAYTEQIVNIEQYFK